MELSQCRSKGTWKEESGRVSGKTCAHVWVSISVCLHSYSMINLNCREKGGKHKTQQHMDSLTLLAFKKGK